MSTSSDRALHARALQVKGIAVQATAMTALAGFFDAVGYSTMGHLYLSFMSGNSTQFGMAIAGYDWAKVILAGAVIATFVAGAFLGSLLYTKSRQRRTAVVLVGELICVLLAWALERKIAPHFALLFVTLAMGMQNAIHQALAGAAIGKSFITGTLYGLGDALARSIDDSRQLATAAALAMSWFSFATGVAIGAATVATFHLALALAIAGTVISLLLILSLFVFHEPVSLK